MNIILNVFLIFVSAILTKLFALFAQHTKLIDIPNERNLHSRPTVRGGGLVFIGLSLFCWFFICNSQFFLTLDQFIFSIAIIFIATISFIDDFYNLSVTIRFFFQCLIAFLIVIFILPSQLDFGLFLFENTYLIAFFLFFAVIWAINHFNFMDGLDGFCASQAIFLLAAYALFFNSAGSLIYQDFCLILISSLAGFLIFNFPPAKIFMGDVGSASLGLITFFIAIIAQKNYQIPILYWFILNSLFLFDSTVTLIRRIIKHEKWFSPHKKHAYQRLKQLGINSRFILLGQAIINGSLFLSVMFMHFQFFNLKNLIIIQLCYLSAIYFFI
ncbi:TPA: glycosyltransferase family 4 protein, partial [Legionella pneumophila]|nr:glycosyltransferase family 4 protein [Legionella pneumophila]HAU1660816.1 glycosyltransferase family 4 protein [Legionella pneumophila]HAU1777538.1 glycosyltransferase family 4 protein [Legionella pneumophila]HDO8709862.1 glycosyltransferase family 4 protein [Legionella pneumophila]